MGAARTVAAASETTGTGAMAADASEAIGTGAMAADAVWIGELLVCELTSETEALTATGLQ